MNLNADINIDIDINLNADAHVDVDIDIDIRFFDDWLWSNSEFYSELQNLFLNIQKCLDQQHLAAAVFERFSNGPNRALLVVTPSDIAGDLGVAECLARFTAPDQGDQFGFFVEALNIPRWVALVVPHAVAVAVGKKNQRPLAIALLKAVGVKLCLTLTLSWILTAALGFQQCQRLAVVTKLMQP